VIFHSDRGCQYTSKEFADFCTINGVHRSMGRRATSDNALTESIFAALKNELVHRGLPDPKARSWGHG
jgi:transposase InsO family protein